MPLAFIDFLNIFPFLSSLAAGCELTPPSSTGFVTLSRGPWGDRVSVLEAADLECVADAAQMGARGWDHGVGLVCRDSDDSASCGPRSPWCPEDVRGVSCEEGGPARRPWAPRARGRHACHVTAGRPLFSRLRLSLNDVHGDPRTTGVSGAPRPARRRQNPGHGFRRPKTFAARSLVCARSLTVEERILRVTCAKC